MPVTIHAGDWLDVRISGVPRRVQVQGWIEGEGDPRIGLEGVLLADIAAAQELTGKLGVLDRIDLVMPASDDEVLGRLKSRLPPEAQILLAGARTEATGRLSAAFETNLQAMSLLGLVVGLFLIYNTMSFAVLQRRDLVATLRLIGVTRSEILHEILLEALVLGLLGSVLGVMIGVAVADGLLERVTRTINDVYFALTIRELIVAPGALARAAGLGLATALLGSLIPARQAAALPPLGARTRSRLEQTVQRTALKAAVLGLIAAALAVPLLFAFEPSLVRAIVGLFLLLGGCALVTPAVVAGFGSLLQRFGSSVSRLAAGHVSRSLSRTGLAVAALSLAFAVALGIEIMTDSFRLTVEDWLGSLMQSDLYLSATARDGEGINPTILPVLREIEGVTAVSAARLMQVESSLGTIDLLGIQPSDPMRPGYRLKEGHSGAVWEQVYRGEAVVVSEPFAARHRLNAGDRMRLASADGWQELPIAGVVYDYRSDRGIALMSLAVYRAGWRDERLTSVGLILASDADTNSVRRAAYAVLGDSARGVEIHSNREIRDHSLSVFDRTFAVTGVLRLLAAGVALVGMVGALLSLHLERLREFAILRSLGLTPRQLVMLVMLQSGYLGVLAGVIALPLGLLVAWILVAVIQKVSFGWSLDLVIPAASLWRTLIIAALAALAAGIYPAWRAARATPLTVLRDE